MRLSTQATTDHVPKCNLFANELARSPAGHWSSELHRELNWELRIENAVRRDFNSAMVRLAQLTALSHLFNPAGGLYYHFRAWRHSHSLWSPLRDWVSERGEQWPQKSDHLIVVGSSAGYTIPSPLLERYSLVTCWDPDPMAPYFFHRRHPMVQAQWIQKDVLSDQWKDLLARHPSADVLFSNFLGQVTFLVAEPQNAPATIGNLRSSLKDRNFASYHDISSLLAPKPWTPPDETSKRPGEKIEFFNENAFDHGTKESFQDLSREYFWWQLLPQHWHLIEWVTNVSSQNLCKSPS